MADMGQTNPNPVSGTTSLHPQNNLVNIFLTAAAVPAHIIMHAKDAVGISSSALAEALKQLYELNIRRVLVVAEVAGQRLAAEAVIYRRCDRRSGRTYFWLYPLQPAQALLRDMLLKYRGGAPYNAKRPLPITILAVAPKLR
jgi:hypothetical protein